MLVRINKYLSDRQICSRRLADKLIQEGLVFVNGNKAQIGQKINPKTDKVVILKKLKYKYFIYHKPRGVLSVKVDNKQKSAIELVGLKNEFAVVGRLDKDSEGLLFITNDGRVVDKMLNPKYGHEREYIVYINKSIKDTDIQKLENGVDIEGYITKKAKARKLSDNKIALTLTEGKKHQVRRMLTALGYEVKRLIRVRIMHLSLKGLSVGEKRELNHEEIYKLFNHIGIKK